MKSTEPVGALVIQRMREQIVKENGDRAFTDSQLNVYLEGITKGITFAMDEVEEVGQIVQEVNQQLRGTTECACPSCQMRKAAIEKTLNSMQEEFVVTKLPVN